MNKKTRGRLADKAVESELTDNGDAKIQAFSKLTQWLEETVLALRCKHIDQYDRNLWSVQQISGRAWSS